VSAPRGTSEVLLDPVAAQAATAWLEGLLTAVGAYRFGTRGKWQCPGHGREGEHAVALAVHVGRRGAVIHCFAGCTLDEVLGSLALRRVHLFSPPQCTPALHARLKLTGIKFPPPKSPGTPEQRGLKFEAHHYYGEGHRKERLRHPVTGEKAISWESRDERGAWIPGLRGVKEADLPLYHETDLRLAIGAGDVIVLCESESSVDALIGCGLYASTWAGGAASPPRRIQAVLGGANVVIVPDYDTAGLACRDRLLELLPNAQVLLGEPGEDARDLLSRVGPNELNRLVTAAASREYDDDFDRRSA
jgi:hypothetical protein